MGASISGTVTEEGTGTPIADCRVLAYLGSETDPRAETRTITNGTYTLGGLPSGSYKVGIFPTDGTHAAEWYNNKVSRSRANSLTLTAPDHYGTAINATLPIGAVIQGTISEEGLSPVRYIPDVTVSIYNYDIGEWLDAQANTDENGFYSIGGLLSGNYKLYFDGGTSYGSEYYNNKTTLSLATRIYMSSDHTYYADAGLSYLKARVLGTITGSETGNPALENIEVKLYDSDGAEINATYTNANGKYEFSDLDPGIYKLGFNGDNGDATHKAEWYSNRYFLSQADAFNLITAQNKTVDAVLSQMGSISGTVQEDVTETPLEGIGVKVYQAYSSTEIGATATGSDGTYSVGSLPAGSYEVFFENDGSHAGEWYDDTYDRASTTHLSVFALEDTANINASLAPGGSISGTVTVEGGGGLSGIQVVAYHATSGQMINYAVTGPSGGFTIGALGHALQGLLRGQQHPYRRMVGQ